MTRCTLFWLMNRLTLAMPLSGLHSSSSRITSTFAPLMPPLALTASISLFAMSPYAIPDSTIIRSVMPTRMVLSCADGRTGGEAQTQQRRRSRGVSRLVKHGVHRVTPPCVARTKRSDRPSFGSPGRVRDQSDCHSAGRRLRPATRPVNGRRAAPASARDDRVAVQFCPCNDMNSRYCVSQLWNPNSAQCPATPGCSSCSTRSIAPRA